MKRKHITSGNMIRRHGNGQGFNVVLLRSVEQIWPKVCPEIGVGKLLEGLPLRIALRILSFWLLCSSLSPG